MKRIQSSRVHRSYPGSRRPGRGAAGPGDGAEETQFETLHADGVATVELDLSALESMVREAVMNRGKRCTDGPVTVRFAGEVRSTWSPARQAWGLPQDPVPVTAGGAE